MSGLYFEMIIGCRIENELKRAKVRGGKSRPLSERPWARKEATRMKQGRQI